MTKKRGKAKYHDPHKLSFQKDIESQPWLSLLIDAYFIIDKGISEAIKQEQLKKRILACGKGCSNCCRTHSDIPVYPLELVGLSWYAVEKVAGPEREMIKKHLNEYRKNDPCPFLLDNSCAVHPMRPISCRQFIVFGKPCDVEEDPYYTRRHDVLSPIQSYVDRAFYIMLPFYGIEKEEDRWRLIKTGSVHNIVRRIQNCNWKSLAEKMTEYDSGNRAAENV